MFKKTIAFVAILLSFLSLPAMATGEKAIAFPIDVYPGGNQFVTGIGYVNATGAVAFTTYVLYDATGLNTPAAIRAATVAAIVNDAVNNQGFTSFTASDVLFNGFDLSAAEAQGLSGYVTSDINGLTVGNTTVFTNTSGRDFIPMVATLVLDTAVGVGTAPVINIGTNSSTYNNMSSSFSLTGLGTTVGKATNVTLSTTVPLVHNGDSVVCRVATAAILTTTYQFRCVVQGIYLN